MNSHLVERVVVKLDRETPITNKKWTKNENWKISQEAKQREAKRKSTVQGCVPAEAAAECRHPPE